MKIKEKVLTEEYWKIEDTLRLIKIAKEDKKKGVIEKTTITKDYINHLSTNINLMREAQRFGEQKKLAEVSKVIDEIECSAQDNAIWFKLKIKQKLGIK